LELDKADNYELLFNLLSFLNSPSTVELIKKNIIGENVIFALEIIENFMTADIKTLIVPLFENTPIWQKIKRYEAFVKIPKLKLNDRLSEIICSDYYIIDDWTRAKAIELVGRDFKRKKSSDINKGDSEQQNFEIKTWETQAVQEILSYIRKSEMPDEIFVALYHPNELVYSTAAKIIYEENPSRCLSYIKSLSEEKQFLRTIFDNINSREHLLIVDKLKFLKRHLLFFNVPEKLLVKIAAILTPLEIKKDTILDMTSDVYSKSVIIVMDGLLGAVGNTSNKNFQKNDVVLLDINFPLDETRLKAKRNTFVFIADRAVYFNLLLDESEILYYIFDDI
jgi:hypothetical protein